MTEVSRILRNIFFPKIPPILKLEVGFFSAKKKIFQDFPKYAKFFLSKLHFCKFSEKSENIFFSFIHPTSSAGSLGREGLGCTRKSGLGLSNFFFFFFFFYCFFFLFFFLFLIVFFSFPSIFFSFFFFFFFFFLFSLSFSFFLFSFIFFYFLVVFLLYNLNFP